MSHIPKYPDDAKLLFAVLAAIEEREPRLKARPSTTSDRWVVEDEIGFFYITLIARHGNLGNEEGLYGSMVLIDVFSGVTFVEKESKTRSGFGHQWHNVVGQNGIVNRHSLEVFFTTVKTQFDSELYQHHVQQVQCGVAAR